MKKRHISKSLKQLFLAVPASALMLGASQAQTTVGLNFQAWYYGGNTTNQAVVGYGKGYQTTGFPVTGAAFGVPVGDWSSTEPLNANFISISTNADFAGTLTAEITAPAMWQSGIGELLSGWTPEVVAPGNNEVTWSYLSDGTTVGDSIGEAPSVVVTGLASKFPHGYVVETIASANGVTSFDPVDITDGTNDSQVLYTTYYVKNPASDGIDIGGTVGISGASSAYLSDTINIDCDAETASNRSTLAGFIITDQPVISRDPTSAAYALGTPFTLSAIVAGVPPLSYQWQTNGVPILGATNAIYTNSDPGVADTGNYTVVVTNLYGSASSGAASVVILFPYAAQTVTWDADPSTTGAQDGDGIWNFSPAMWWTGSSDETWWTNDAAVFGVGGAGPYTVTLAADMVATSLTFNSGNYTITNSSLQSITLQGASTTVTANSAGTISVPFSTGTNTFFKAGSGFLDIAAGGMSSGQTYVEDGTLEVLAKSGDSPYIITNGATLEIGYTTGGGYANTGMELYGDGTAATTGLYLKGGTTYNVSGTVTLEGGPTTIRQYGSGFANIGIFDIHSTGLLVNSAASGSIIASNIYLVTYGYGMASSVAAGAHTATGDLIVNGPLNIQASGNGPYGFVKSGAGSVRLNAVATPTNSGLEVLAGTVICGIDQCIGANASLEIMPGATLDFNGTSQTVTNVLTFNGAQGMLGNLSMSINKGGTPSSTVLTEADGNQMGLGGTLTVTNIGGPLVLGDTFTLFSDTGGFGGGFTYESLPTLSDGLGWQDNTAVDGTIQVIKGSIPPSIVTNLPATTNFVYVGGTTSMSITAAGDPTLRYQWLQNGTTPVGTDSPTLTLSSVTAAAAGSYFVVVSNDYGFVDSATNYLTVVPTSGYDALIVASDPVAFWPLNESSGTTAFDYWGGYDATYNGGIDLDLATNPVTEVGAAYFDGSDGYALTPYYPALNPPVFSAEAWVNPATAPSSEFCVLSCGQFASSGRSGWLIYQMPTNWNFRTYYGVGTTTAANVNGVSNPALGDWTHLAVTWDGTTARLYVNGTLEGSQVPTTTPNYQPGASGGFCVGARADISFYWGGYASDAVLYNHVLTPQEISAHAQNQPLLAIASTTNGPTKDIVLSWTGSGTVQASPTLTGTYTNVPGATSPWTNAPSGQSMFYRLKF